MESGELTVYYSNQGGTAVKFYRPWSFQRSFRDFLFVLSENSMEFSPDPAAVSLSKGTGKQIRLKRINLNPFEGGYNHDQNDQNF